MSKSNFSNNPQPEFSQPFKKDWIQLDFNDETLDFAKLFGKYLVEAKFTTNQLRNFYGEVIRIKNNQPENVDTTNMDMNKIGEWKVDLLMLRPKLAYAAGRNNQTSAKKFQKIMDEALASIRVSNEDINIVKGDFKRFFNFFQSILAYHKGFGGN